MREYQTKDKTEDEIADMDAEHYHAGALAGRDSWPELAEPASHDIVFANNRSLSDQHRHWDTHPTPEEEKEGFSHKHRDSDSKRRWARQDEMESDELLGQHEDHEKNQRGRDRPGLREDEDNPRTSFR